jgi:hypothetical protein
MMFLYFFSLFLLRVEGEAVSPPHHTHSHPHQTPPPRGQDSIKKDEKFQEYYDKYNMSNVQRGKGAIGDAVNYLIEQDRIRSEKLNDGAGKDHVNYKNHPNSNGDDLPICQVSFDSVADDTYFTFLGNVPPEYDYNTCPVLHPRYHVAPICEQKEREEGIVQLYQWDWTLLAAKKGHCKMPDPSPVHAAKSFLENKIKSGKTHRPITPTSRYPQDKPGRAVNILFLGLSFMGEPFHALLCKHHKDATLVDGFVDYTEGEVERQLPLTSILKSEPRCSNACEDCFKSELHPPASSPSISSVRFPKEKSSTYYEKTPNTHCSPRLAVFESPKGHHDPVTVRMCYQYTFNLAKNQQRLYSKLPCGMTWDDIDVIFTIHSFEEFSAYYYRGTGGNIQALPHVHVVHISGIYEGLMMKGISATYASHKLPSLELVNMRGRPNDCSGSDVHLRMPGIPDFAVKVRLAS